MNHRDELLPCPFCGGGAQLETRSDGASAIQCRVCEVQQRWFPGGAAEAFASWNSRISGIIGNIVRKDQFVPVISVQKAQFVTPRSWSLDKLDDNDGTGYVLCKEIDDLSRVGCYFDNSLLVEFFDALAAAQPAAHATADDHAGPRTSEGKQ